MKSSSRKQNAESLRRSHFLLRPSFLLPAAAVQHHVPPEAVRIRRGLPLPRRWRARRRRGMRTVVVHLRQGRLRLVVMLAFLRVLSTVLCNAGFVHEDLGTDARHRLDLDAPRLLITLSSRMGWRGVGWGMSGYVGVYSIVVCLSH